MHFFLSLTITVSSEEVPPDLPYMIRRSRTHNVPVYTDIKHGSQKSTVVRKVEGDIWVSVTHSSYFIYFNCSFIYNVVVNIR